MVRYGTNIWWSTSSDCTEGKIPHCYKTSRSWLQSVSIISKMIWYDVICSRVAYFRLTGSVTQSLLFACRYIKCLMQMKCVFLLVKEAWMNMSFLQFVACVDCVGTASHFFMFTFSGSLELSAEGEWQYSVHLHSAWRLNTGVPCDAFLQKRWVSSDCFIPLSLL